MKKIVVCLCCAALAIMNSCLGAQADIGINADGSGKIALEYRVSQMLESLGKLDGNERWPALPVGKADFQRSLARIPDIKLSSYSAKKVPAANGSADLVTRAVLEFKNTEALLAFLDSAGTHASLVQDNGTTVLRLVLMESETAIHNADLLSLIQEISAGYEISLSLSAPKSAVIAVQPSSVSSARLVSQGKKVSFAIGIAELLSLEDGLAIEMSW